MASKAADLAALLKSLGDRSAWQTYRQALRDIPDQTGFPEEIEWPTAPSNHEETN